MVYKLQSSCSASWLSLLFRYQKQELFEKVIIPFITVFAYLVIASSLPLLLVALWLLIRLVNSFPAIVTMAPGSPVIGLTAERWGVRLGLG